MKNVKVFRKPRQRGVAFAILSFLVLVIVLALGGLPFIGYRYAKRAILSTLSSEMETKMIATNEFMESLLLREKALA